MLVCCLVSFHFLLAILSTSTVDLWLRKWVKSRAFLLRRRAVSPSLSGASHALPYPEISPPQYISCYFGGDNERTLSPRSQYHLPALDQQSTSLFEIEKVKKPWRDCSALSVPPPCSFYDLCIASSSSSSSCINICFTAHGKSGRGACGLRIAVREISLFLRALIHISPFRVCHSLHASRKTSQPSPQVKT